MIKIKNDQEILIMFEGGKILKRILKQITLFIKPSISTKDVENYSIKLFKKEKVKSSFLHYQGYPGVICVSINDEIVHGIPKKEKIILPGDVVSVDIGIIYKGYNVDSAATLICGNVKSSHKKLIKITKKALDNAILKIKPNIHLSDISYEIQKTIEDSGFQVIKECSGHGIGQNLHEDPSIPNFGIIGEGPILMSGMVLAVEPMAVEGKSAIQIKPDHWTISTIDKSYSAHFEHTIAVTNKGHLVLT